MRLVGVPSAHVAETWPVIHKWVVMAADRSNGRYTAEDYLHFIQERDMQLWLVVGDFGVDAFLITEIINYPRSRWLRIAALGGRNHRDWFGAADAGLEAFAKDKGCIGIEAGGRKGFYRQLVAHLGWNNDTTLFDRRI